MLPTIRAIAAFAVCFGVGTALSVLFGLSPREWIVPALVTSASVALSVRRRQIPKLTLRQLFTARQRLSR
jgi:hypothetical protein